MSVEQPATVVPEPRTRFLSASERERIATDHLAGVPARRTARELGRSHASILAAVKRPEVQKLIRRERARVAKSAENARGTARRKARALDMPPVDAADAETRRKRSGADGKVLRFVNSEERWLAEKERDRAAVAVEVAKGWPLGLIVGHRAPRDGHPPLPYQADRDELPHLLASGWTADDPGVHGLCVEWVAEQADLAEYTAARRANDAAAEAAHLAAVQHLREVPADD